MLNCNDTTRLYSEAQDRKLTLGERLSLRLHVLVCSACRNFGQQMKFLNRAMRAYGEGKNENTDNTKKTREPEDE